MRLDPITVLAETTSFLRPIGWRGARPNPADLDGCLLFDRDRRVRSFDGTEIAYTVHGAGGPWVAVVPGFCCPDTFWKYLVPALGDAYRVIVWDPRGLGMSGMPRTPGYRARRLSWEDFSIPNVAQDLEAVLDREGVGRVALIGHSLGGQIMLEEYRRAPERVSVLVALTAPYESPIRTFYGRDFEGVLKGIGTLVYGVPRPAIVLWRALFLANPALTHRLAQLIRALGPEARAEDMVFYYRHLGFLDPLVMLKMAEAMRAHSAADVLATVTVPTLVVAASQDTFTPISLARAMHERVARSELVIIEGGTHGAVIERPGEVNEAVRSFLDRHLRPAPAGLAGPRE